MNSASSETPRVPVMQVPDHSDTLSLDERIEKSVERATKALIDLQTPAGCWCFELEADCTIPSDIMMHRIMES